MKLSINILTWNTWKWTHETIHVLSKELKDVDAELIIVDNGSTDGGESVATIANGRNLGISKGKNQGIEVSRGEYILLLDGDIIPPPGTVTCMMNMLEAHPEMHALGVLGNKFSSQRNKGEEFDRNHEEHHEWRCRELVNIQPQRGHCVYFGMYRRTVFDVVRFDENYDKVCRLPAGEWDRIVVEHAGDIKAAGGIENFITIMAVPEDWKFIGGYGWEDFDTYMQMEKAGIVQYTAGINHPAGKYFHAINSSFNPRPGSAVKCMAFREYMTSSAKRNLYFKAKWEAVLIEKNMTVIG